MTRIVTALLIALPVAVCALVLLVFGSAMPDSPPTLEELQKDFVSRRADLETILRMSEEDTAFPRIAPDFIVSGMRSYMYGDPQNAMSTKRWEDYRKLFARNGIKLGVQRWNNDIFVIVNSEGILNRGHSVGYLHCASARPSNADGYEPCTGIDPSQKPRAASRRIENHFHKLDGNWYAFDEDANE